MRRFMFAAGAVLSLLSCVPTEQLGPTHSSPNRPTIGIGLSGGALPSVRISEIHYDNAGTDAGEAIEVSGPAGVDVTGWRIVLYNGNGGATYEPTRTLTGAFPATCGDRGVLVQNYPVNGIQNGEPDGLALVDAGGVVVEFLSYEGTLVATNGPALGMTSVDIGKRELGSEPLGLSLQRDGSDVWSAPIASTFGACNDNDVPPPPPTVARVVVTPAAATDTTGGTESFTAAAFDAADQPIASTTFTWSTTAPTVATVNATGVATAAAPGDAGIVATAPNGVADTAEFHVNAPPPPGLPPTRFSELHYDNAGVDAGESIEIEGPAGVDLTGWSVVLYNGNGGVVYNTRALTGPIPATCGTRGVVVLTYPQDGIQNGSPDGMALVSPSGVVEFLSYEGAIVATAGPAVGTTSRDIIASEASSSPLGQSLQRDAENHWTLATSTFGACNGGGEPPPPPASTITFSGRVPSDPALPVGFQDQLFATLRDGSGTVVPTTFTWSSETPGLASIDQNGVFTALGAGTMVLRATAAEGTTGTFALPSRVGVASTTALYAGNAEFGEPTDGNPSDDFIVRHREYTASYNNTRGSPNWVSYDLELSHFGSEDRCDCFTFDPALPPSFTTLTTADYTGAGAFHGFGIDRGHLARSFDRTSGSLDNAFTFYFTNIVPQAADLNQGPWSNMEIFLGDLARFSNREVYIITGASGNAGTIKNEGKIVIPTHTWKVAVIMGHDEGLADVHSYADVEVIAVIMPNVPGVRFNDWHIYETTVDAVEALSGYDLLALLRDDIEIAVESKTQPPSAATNGPYESLPNLMIPMSGAGSSDPDGDALTYDWSFGDGSTGGGVAVTHAYGAPGVYSVRLVVTDIRGLADTTFTTATIISPVAALAAAMAMVDPLVAAGNLSDATGKWIKNKLDNAIALLNKSLPLPAVNQLTEVLRKLDGTAHTGALAGAIDNILESVRP